MTPQFIEASLCGGGCHNTRQSCVSTATKVSCQQCHFSKDIGQNVGRAHGLKA